MFPFTGPLYDDRKISVEISAVKMVVKNTWLICAFFQSELNQGLYLLTE
jgi:hypothetical protein